MKRSEAITGVILFLFGGITALLSLRMPIGTFRMAGSGLFPLCLGLLLMGLASLFLLTLYFQNAKVTEKKGKVEVLPGSSRQIILFMGTMVLATLFFNRLGYPLTSFLLMLALLKILGVRRWATNVFISLITVMASYLLFVRWLQIPLPKGWIGF
ncbi:MAG: tripartite tricarboxylate transporter TctB family protein [Deltaproteobacteria bacterium]|nr:tripartite tricarboxylate transporter TctB family protein [Deltaproteobacteria bacterium]